MELRAVLARKFPKSHNLPAPAISAAPPYVISRLPVQDSTEGSALGSSAGLIPTKRPVSQVEGGDECEEEGAPLTVRSLGF